jgi:2-dehydro-3-deoxygluconokinase
MSTNLASGLIFDVTTIGEVMLRLSVPAGHHLETARSVDLNLAGAESNVVGALCQLGRRCGWVTALPRHALGELVAHHLRAACIDLTAVVWRDSGRVGTYFLEFALPPRPTQAIYDRADSCAARLQPEDIDWDYVLQSRILHLTGITPALSPGCAAVTAEAVRRAREASVPVSFDVNYRQLLWAPEAAAAALTPLIQGVDLLLCSQRDARRVFALDGTPEEIVRALVALSKARQVVLSIGEDGALAWDGARILHQPAVPVVVVDRLGAGDALAAGVIHGWLDGDLKQGLRYGAMLAALALSQHGDMVMETSQELEALLCGEGTDVEI